MINIQTAVVDTGPLFTALGLNYVRRANLPAPKAQHIVRRLGEKTLQGNSDLQDRYLALIAGIRTPLTTSHVIGELQGLQSSRLGLWGDDLRFFWMHSIDFLLTRSFEERLVQLLCMKSDEWRALIGAIGPPDTGLINLARKERCRLVTDDVRTLVPRARAAGVECVVVREVIAGY